ncbi:unnamed protein product [Boreogadus saida]
MITTTMIMMKKTEGQGAPFSLSAPVPPPSSTLELSSAPWSESQTQTQRPPHPAEQRLRTLGCVIPAHPPGLFLQPYPEGRACRPTAGRDGVGEMIFSRKQLIFNC